MQDVATVARMTAQEYLAIPYDGVRSDLVEGEVVVTSPRPLHQRVCRDLFRALDEWARAAAGRGEVMFPLDVLIDERNVFAPDLLWFEDGHVLAEDSPSPVPGIAVEVRSPSTWRYDIGAKKAAYERNGLPELWLVDTSASEVLVFRRSAAASPSFDVALELEAHHMLESPQLPGFAISVGTLIDG